MWAEHEEYVRTNLQQIGDTEFPDNIGLPWKILGFDHRPDMVAVEVEPERDEVGYPRFLWILTFTKPKKPLHYATYALKNGQYTLLATLKVRSGLKLPAVWS